MQQHQDALKVLQRADELQVAFTNAIVLEVCERPSFTPVILQSTCGIWWMNSLTIDLLTAG